LLTYEMTQCVLTRIKRNGEKSVCYRCGKLIALGDLEVSKTGISSPKKYHKRCYEEMLI
jgi:hypothetical protein